jgi:3-oxoacyl-[acyl-carrier protein] reductase
MTGGILIGNEEGLSIMATQDLPVAIVTGAARGIGLASATEMAKRGYRVALSDLGSAELEEATSTLAALGVATMSVPGDVSDHAAVQGLAAAVIARWGRIDVLVNNAGVSAPKPILEISEAEWDRTMAINLKGCFNWCKAVAPGMVERQRGRIINISSVSATTGGAPSAVSKFAYCASKAGILGLTRGLAKELAPYVSVNAVCPGSIETHLTRALIAAHREAITATIPLGRIGTPEDIAVVVAFLATVEPNFITGEVVDVDGGQWIN